MKHIWNWFFTPNPDLTELTVAITSCLATLQCYEDEEDHLELFLESQDLPRSTNQCLSPRKSLDSFELREKMHHWLCSANKCRMLIIARLCVDIWADQSKHTLLDLGIGEISQTTAASRACERSLVSQFYDNAGKNFLRQYVVPKHFREELLYRVHNNKFGGHLGLKATAHKIQKRFSFPMLSESRFSFEKLLILFASQACSEKLANASTATLRSRSVSSGWSATNWPSR